MTHRQHFDFYIASCDTEGGILKCRFAENSVEILEKTTLDRPMYMAFNGDKMEVILRDPENKNESGLVTLDICSLKQKGQVISTKGNVACHLCVLDGNVYCANYLSGSVIKMPDKVVTHSGKGINEKRQEMPHVHYINSFDGKYLLCTDLGTDEIYTYDKDLNEISRVKIPSRHGPRHLDFFNGKVYCLNELKSTLSILGYDDGKLTLNETVGVLPEDFKGESYSSAIRVKDRYIYTSNRGHNSISVIEPQNSGARLIKTVDCGGKWPRDFNIFGKILVCTNEESDNVTFFELKDGIPEKIDLELKVKSPICVI